MSIPELAATTPSGASFKPKPAVKSHKESTHQAGLDAAISRLRDAIPETPYILTVPLNAENEYHHYSRHEAESWRYNTPFERGEEHLQYTSFLYRDHLDSCFVVRTHVDEERDRRARLGLNGVATGTANRASTGPKKKISLADYKNKAASARQSGPAAATAKPQPPTANGTKADEPKPASMAPLQSQGRKRSLDDHLEVQPATATTATTITTTTTTTTTTATQPDTKSQPLAKKARPSAPPAKPSPKPQTPSGTPHGLPPLQSPLKVESAPHGLPPMLSPTLPAAIEIELSRQSSEAPLSSNPSSAEKPLKQKTSGPAKSSANVTKKNESTPSKAPAGGGDEARPTPLNNAASERPRVKDRPSADGKSVDGERPLKKPRLIVRLKYGRNLRKRVENLLKLPPRRVPPPKVQPESQDRVEKASRADVVHDKGSGATNHKSQRSDQAQTKPVAVTKPNGAEPAKRKRLDDERRDLQAPKRQKATLAPERPSTPVQPRGPSPSTTTLSSKSTTQQRPPNETPRKHLGSVQMARSLSTDSNSRTPQATGGTPSVPRPTSAPSKENPLGARFSSLGSKYSSLGRKLKHEHQDLMAKKDLTERDRKRAAVAGLQSILCFMLLFHCLDVAARLEHRAVSLTNTWMTCLPLWSQHLRGLAPYPHLEGLHYHLGVVIRNTIAQIIGERMRSNARAESLAAERDSRNGSADAPTPTPSSSAVAAAANPLAGLPPVDAIGKNLTELHRYAVQASSKLSAQDLMSSFPKSWAAQQSGASSGLAALDRDPDQLLSGNWHLPIGVHTTAVQGVRAGVKLLEEWVERNAEGLKLSISNVLNA